MGIIVASRRRTPKPQMCAIHGSRTPSVGTCGPTSAQTREMDTVVNMRRRFENRRPSRTGVLTNPAVLQRRGEEGGKGERTGSPGRVSPISRPWGGERDHPQGLGFIGDTPRSERRHTKGAVVN